VGVAFWSRLRDTPETWPEMERAAHQRYWDGLTLANGDSGCGTLAIYCWGYVAELLLKCADLSLRSIPATEDVSRTLQGLGIRHHRLFELLEDVVTARAGARRPFDAAIEGALRTHVATLEQNWGVGLRYRCLLPTEDELEECGAAADWLVKHYDRWARGHV
jgi:hypothetical protein